MTEDDRTGQDAPLGELNAAGNRREVLRRLGLYSAVTAPVLLGLLNAEKAVAQTIPGDCGIGGGGCF